MTKVTIQSLRINPIHNRWELMLKDVKEHYFPVYLEEHQAELIRQGMIKPYSLKLSDIAIPDIDFKANRIVSVIIDDLKKGILKTQLVLQLNDVVSQVDYPAEKAIALALKEGIPIVM